ncbi:MAG: hypothetical protein PXY39_05885, partial [archaeon]|nr:hypothetical protein [archaeon]
LLKNTVLRLLIQHFVKCKNAGSISFGEKCGHRIGFTLDKETIEIWNKTPMMMRSGLVRSSLSHLTKCSNVSKEISDLDELQYELKLYEEWLKEGRPHLEQHSYYATFKFWNNRLNAKHWIDTKNVN